MKRRNCLVGLVGGVGVMGISPSIALAQGAGNSAGAGAEFLDGRHFRTLKTAAPVRLLDPSKRIDIVEFFWYGCPHCHSFEPSLTEWSKRLSLDVQVRRVPVAFGSVHQFHQKLFYALERMPDFERLHLRAFAAIHLHRRRLDSLGSVEDWANAEKLDTPRLMAALKSMEVDMAARQARLISDAYQVDSVPSLGVNGRFVTSPGMAGSYERAFSVVEMLMRRRA